MERWAGKVAVVTGASAGIGLAVARAFVREGFLVVGLARRKARMEENMASAATAKGQFFAIECDVTREESVSEAFQKIERDFGGVHVLVNNAGIVRLQTIADARIEDIRDQFSVNVMGVIHCSREAIRLMKKADQDAHIVNMCSIQGHRVYVVPGLWFNVYSATKHAVRGISETLTKELLGGKIRVTNISPGVVNSDIFDATDFDKTPYAHFPTLQPEDIAEVIVFAVSRPHHVQIAELTVRPLGEAI